MNSFLSKRFLLLCLLSLAPLASWAAPRPNIILAMADDMGWGDPSYNSMTVTYADGSPHPDQGWIQTPVMDTMAANGLQFDQFYSASAVCSPTRGSCLTGRNSIRFGIGGANTGRLEFDETPLSEVLSDAGYATGHFGKWHLGTMTTLRQDANRGEVGNTNEYSAPWHHGYDVCFATESKVPTYDPYSGGGPLATNFTDPNFYGTRYWTMPTNWSESGGEGVIVPVEVVNNDAEGDDSKLLVDQAIPFMQEAVSNSQPFFLVLWFHTPHKPLIDPDGTSSVNSPDALHDSIRDMDVALGRVRDELTSLGVRSNTMFWLTSDNGPENGANSSNETDVVRSIRSGRYLDRKGKLFDGGIIVPGILEWPEMISSGRTTDFPAVTSDYYPTIIDYLCLTVPDQKPLDGISLRPLIEGTATNRSMPIGFKLGNDKAWRSGKYKLVDQDTDWLLYDMTDIAPGEESEQTPLATQANVGSQPQAIQDIYNTLLAEYSAWETAANNDLPYVHTSQPTVVLSTPSTFVSGAFAVTATFNKVVTQLEVNEFAVHNGSASSLSGSGTLWSVTVTPSVGGLVTVSLPNGAVIDAEGNVNAASNPLNITNSNPSAPNVSLTTPSDPVATSFVVTATFDEDVSGLVAGDFVLTNGTASGLAGGPAIYTVTVMPTVPGAVSIYLPAGVAQDAATNVNNLSSNLMVTFDPPAAPTVSLGGPANVTGAYTVTVTFSESVTGLVDGDFTVVNGSASGVAGSGAAYTVYITPGVVGSVSVTLPADSVTDLDDALGNIASSPLITTYAAEGESTGTLVETSFSVSEGQTVDSDDTVPADQSNNIEKFTAGTVNSGATNPFTSTLYLRGASPSTRKVRTFISFDLSSLMGQPVASAFLTFNAHSLNTSGSTDIEALALAADWSPSGTNLPTYLHSTVGSLVSGGDVTVGLDSEFHTRDYTFDITDMVRNWSDGTWPNYGLILRLTDHTVNTGIGIQPSGDGAVELVVTEMPVEVTQGSMNLGSGQFIFEWSTVQDLAYQVETTEDLFGGTWQFVSNISGVVTGTTSYTYPIAMSNSISRFYRVLFSD